MPLAALLQEAARTDRTIKGIMSGDPWSSIIALTMGMARALQASPKFRQGSRMNPMGIFGGTLDPIHSAHLRTAFELQQALRLKEIRFLPAGNPPHRDRPTADPQLRLKMVRARDRRSSGFCGR